MKRRVRGPALASPRCAASRSGTGLAVPCNPLCGEHWIALKTNQPKPIILRSQLVILNEVKNLTRWATRSFAGAQDDTDHAQDDKWGSPLELLSGQIRMQLLNKHFGGTNPGSVSICRIPVLLRSLAHLQTNAHRVPGGWDRRALFG